MDQETAYLQLAGILDADDVRASRRLERGKDHLYRIILCLQALPDLTE